MNTRNKNTKVTLTFSRKLLIYLFIVVAIFTAYWQLPKSNFISFDDDVYVTDNIHVQKGFTGKTIRWAFTTFHAFNWHPLTWLSHMADYQLFGKNASLHHLMNMFFHIINSLILFVLLNAMTKDIWPSAIVAALFAIHPLHVESVAWISERKDVLSTFFAFLTIGCYFIYTRNRKIHSYFFVFFFYMLGLMAKPMLVTLPFLLLILDYWPLQRMNIGFSAKNNLFFSNKKSIGFLVSEKIPLLFLSAALSIITIIAQKEGGIVRSIQEFPVAVRLANAAISYVRYMYKMVLPVHLSFFYPYRTDWPLWMILGSTFLIVSVSVYTIKKITTEPFLFVGWFWYVGTLIPVIGLVQVASQSMADRYTYIPLIGLFMILAWGIKRVVKKIRCVSTSIFPVVYILLTLLMILTWKQVGYWKNDITLFSHAVDVTENNPRSNYHLGIAFQKKGNITKAIEYYNKAIAIKPDFLRARNSLGNALVKLGKYEDAINHYRYALTLKKNNADGHFNLGFALMNLGRNNEAIEHYKKAIEMNRKHGDSYYNLGIMLSRQQKYKQALKCFAKVVEINPKDAEAYNNMGNCLIRLGKIDEAIKSYKMALLINPDYELARENLNIAQQQIRKK